MKKSRSITMYKRTSTIVITIIVTLLFGIGATWFYLDSYSKRYIKPSFDTSYTEGKVEVDEKYGYSEMQVAEEYKVGLCGEPRADSEGVDLYFSNPEGNNALLKCLLLDEDNNAVGESGLINPNSYIKTVKFNQTHPTGNYPLVIKVLGFEPETYYSKGVVNLKININIE